MDILIDAYSSSLLLTQDSELCQVAGNDHKVNNHCLKTQYVSLGHFLQLQTR